MYNASSRDVVFEFPLERPITQFPLDENLEVYARRMPHRENMWQSSRGYRCSWGTSEGSRGNRCSWGTSEGS